MSEHDFDPVHGGCRRCAGLPEDGGLPVSPDTSEADSEQWRQFDARQREAGEFVRALVTGGLMTVKTDEQEAT